MAFEEPSLGVRKTRTGFVHSWRAYRRQYKTVVEVVVMVTGLCLVCGGGGVCHKMLLCLWPASSSALCDMDSQVSFYTDDNNNQ